MFFQKKLDRAMEWIKPKSDNVDKVDSDKFEKNDLAAILIAALIVFGPIFLLLIWIMTLVL